MNRLSAPHYIVVRWVTFNKCIGAQMNHMHYMSIVHEHGLGNLWNMQTRLCGATREIYDEFNDRWCALYFMHVIINSLIRCSSLHLRISHILWLFVCDQTNFENKIAW